MKRSDRAERMEDPSLSLRELREGLDALDRTHRWFGTFRPVVRIVNQLLPREGQTLRVLDVGAGSGLLGERLNRRFGGQIHYLRLDPSERILNLDSGREGEWKILGRGPGFPIRPGCADVVVSSLVLHHLPDPDLEPFLRECLHLSRGHVIHHDLQRCWGLFLALWLLGRVLIRNPMFRHDAPLSVRRSRTLGEWRDFLDRRSLDAYRLEAMFPWRINLIASREDGFTRSNLADQPDQSPGESA